MRYSLVAPALLASTVYAWLPQDRDLAAFNQTARFEQLGKRFEPSLASGVTKIRGVNFGGRSKYHYFLHERMYQAHIPF
jgi:hypothetical protein